MKTTDKPIDIMDDKNQDTDAPIQTPEKEALAQRVQMLLRGSYEAKDQMDLMNKWAKFDDYKHGIQNVPSSPEQPGSTTNIIIQTIESQISDLTDKPLAIEAKGREPGDHMFSDDCQHMLEFVMDKNQFPVKLDISEHDRLELGTTIVKVYFDSEALDKKGLPSFEIISPANFFPDPKWTASHLLQEGEFQIHAVPRALSWIRRKWPKLGKYVKRQVSFPYDPALQIEATKTDEVSPITSQKAMVVECYLKDDNGELYSLTVANNILLEDSREVLKGKKLQRRNMFPFVAIPCYAQRGTGWGQGDVEILIPTQDLINEMDDQIRMAARMMGNPQIAYGMNIGKGFNDRKWTNAAGLRVPMRDVSAFKVIEPVPVSRDVVQRREKAFEEANIISGRPDVNRGEAPGQITAASAIMALQQAGQKTVVHKARMWKEGWKQVLGLLYDEMVDNWDEPFWIRIDGHKTDYQFMDPSQLQNVPIMAPNLSPSENESSIKPLMNEPQPIMDENKQPMMHPPMPMMGQDAPMMDELGNPMYHPPQPMMMPPKPMTRTAEFDLELAIGDGLPSDKSFIYQTLIDLSKVAINGQPVISWQELRDYLRDQVGIPLMDDDKVAPPPMPGQPSLPGQTPQLQLMQGGAH